MGDDFKRRVLESDGTPRSLINIYINGKNAKFSGGMETSLKEGDEMSTFYLLSQEVLMNYPHKNLIDFQDK